MKKAMLKLLLILVVALLFEAVGVVFLSKGLKELVGVNRVTFAEITRFISDALTNSHLLLGVFFEAIFFAGLLILMSKGDVSFIWPLTSLGFVLTTVAAKFFLHEHISPARWFGVFLIMLGAGLITWTEKMKTPAAPVAAPAVSRETPFA